MALQKYKLNGKEYIRHARGDRSAPPKHQTRATDRVEDILHVLFIHTYLTTKQVHRLVSPSIRQDTITHKLRDMCRKKWIAPPDGQRNHENFKANDLYYQITRDGVDVLM